jgi:hypothetical protein
MTRNKVMMATLAAISFAAVIEAVAQDVPQQAQQPMAYPQAGIQQQQPAGPRPNPLRELFAGTLTAVLQGVTTGMATGLTQGVSGGIAGWFDRRQRKAGSFGQPAYVPQSVPPYGTQPLYTTPQPTNPNQTSPYPTDPYSTAPANGYPTAPATGYPTAPATGTYPTTPAPGTYSTAPAAGYPTAPTTGYPTAPTTGYPTAPTGTYPTTPAAGTYSTAPAAPGTNVYGAAAPGYDWSSTQVYDPRTGQMTSAQAGGYAVASPPPDATQIVAGGAYDVHVVGPGGNETYVNAATQEFRTGDRFKVYFRATLPGRLDVSNINPYGRETRIDSVEVAAGQLTTLGPYEFTATKGDESLRFVISPCMTQQLLVATRDIVNVYASAQPAYGAQMPAGGGLPLSACGSPTTRSANAVKTRDIQKVGVDGTTSFALDPVSQAELASGQLAPREFTVWFHHR